MKAGNLRAACFSRVLVSVGDELEAADTTGENVIAAETRVRVSSIEQEKRSSPESVAGPVFMRFDGDGASR